MIMQRNKLMKNKKKMKNHLDHNQFKKQFLRISTGTKESKELLNEISLLEILKMQQNVH